MIRIYREEEQRICAGCGGEGRSFESTFRQDEEEEDDEHQALRLPPGNGSGIVLLLLPRLKTVMMHYDAGADDRVAASVRRALLAVGLRIAAGCKA